MGRRSAVVLEPPLFQDRYVWAEECCWGYRRQWTVPARALQVASAAFADYYTPRRSWAETVQIAAQYAEVYMVVTYPLWEAFAEFALMPAALQSRFTLLANPADYVDWIRRATKAGNVVAIDSAFLQRDHALPWIEERFHGFYDGTHPATIQAASGCGFRCNYCVWGMRRTRWADPAQVAALSLAVPEAYILAPQLNQSQRFVEAFLSARGESRQSFKTTINCACSELLAAALALGGMSRCEVGTEAFSATALERLGCPHTIDQAFGMMDVLTDRGVMAQYELRYGYGETVAEIEETRRNLRKHGAPTMPHRLHTGPIYYWEGTRLPEPPIVENVTQHGCVVTRGACAAPVMKAWRHCWEDLRAAGWNVC